MTYLSIRKEQINTVSGSDVYFIPTGSISGSNIQDAMLEVYNSSSPTPTGTVSGSDQVTSSLDTHYVISEPSTYASGSIRVDAMYSMTQNSFNLIPTASVSESYFHIITDAINYSQPTASDTTDIHMGYHGGHYVYMNSPSTASIFTLFSSSLGGWSKIKISGSTTQPIVTGSSATLITSSAWISSSEQYIVVDYNGVRAEYFFLNI